MTRDFQSFIKQLEAGGELAHIKAEVDPYLEVGAIADKISKQPFGGSALIFDNIKNASMPVAMNVFGSKKRIAMALSPDQELIDLDAIAIRIEKMIQEMMPHSGSGLLSKINKLSMFAEIGSWMPKTISKGLCQEVIWRDEEAKLSRLPVITTWPEDGGPFITLGLSHIKHPNGQQNMGLYRLQLHDDYTLGFHAQLHHDGARIYCDRPKDNRLPIAISFGGDPVLTYAATAPLPPFVSEILFAGFLRKKSMEMVRCITNDLEVPANSEIIIEGWIDPQELRLEGPFGDHTGYYSNADNYPVIHVKAITHRKNPVFPATIVGRPPSEDAYF
jgi:4-hydroxy-3-polyprenylbenzoate decarboxylase